MSKPTAFPLDESRLPFEIPRDEPYREKIARLGQMITERIPAKKGILTKDDPEYWGLASIVTDEMADVALKMKVRKPMTLPELVKATGKPAGELEPLLQQMAVVGLLEYNWENPRREKQYILPMFVPGSAEFFNMNKQQIADHPEVTAFFERMTFLPLEHITAMVPPGGAGIGMHVIPVEKAIEMENQSVNVEHISHWLKKYDGKYAASPCSCRMSRCVLGEGCADDPEDWCIGVGDMADYLVETHKGHYVDYDEVMQILKRAEDNGFVHQITNIDGENKIFAICNCNVNVCYALRTSQLFNTPNLSRSAYVARVNPEDCVACGRCVEYCPAGAVKLGQKLCTKEGPVIYPQQELPDAVKAYCENYAKSGQTARLVLDDKRIVTKKLVEVVYFFSIRHHIYLVTLEETAELSAREYTLEKLEEQFSRSGFLRIHKSYLLNYRYVYHIGNDTVELTPHRLKKLPLSHRRSAAVRKRYQYFMRGEDDT